MPKNNNGNKKVNEGAFTPPTNGTFTPPSQENKPPSSTKADGHPFIPPAQETITDIITIEELTIQLRNARDQVGGLNDNINSLTVKLETIKKEKDKALSDYYSALTRISNLESINGTIKDECDKALSNYNNSLTRISNLISVINDVKVKRDQVLTDYNNSLKKISNLSNENSSLKSKIEDLDKRINQLNNREPKTKEVKVARNIWMPWVIVMTLLLFAEVAVFGVCINNMFKYVDNTLLIIALAVVSFTIVLLAIVNVVHFAKQEYFRYNHKKAGSVFLWIILALLVTGGAFLSIFSPILFIQ